MKTKLLTICLLFFTSQAYAWSEKEYKLEYDACIRDNLIEQSPYFNSHIERKTYTFLAPYCHCSVHLIAKNFTRSEVEVLKSSGNFEENKDVQEIFIHCVSGYAKDF